MKSDRTFSVNLQPRARTPLQGDEFEAVCDFEGGYAACLEPYFDRINEQSGEVLVFLNGATFGGNHLEILARLLGQVRRDIAPNSEDWLVSLGWQLEPPHEAREKMEKVNKSRFHEKIAQVEAAITLARQREAFVRFDFWGGNP